MKKLFCVVLLALFALPVVANTPEKKVGMLSRVVNISTKGANMPTTINMTGVKKVKQKKEVCVCAYVILSCNVQGTICGSSVDDIVDKAFRADEMHCP